MDLKSKCLAVRKNILIQLGTLGVGHIGGSLSIVELLVVLYINHMNVNPKQPNMKKRDRLIVSKGHSGPAVYAMLCEMGYFPKTWLKTLNKPRTNLPSHCDMNLTPGIDMTTGSLGQGFSCAVGIALASKLKKDGAYIYAIVGDGESQEGQIWEAAMFAAHHNLDNLIAFTDRNNLQLDGETEDICRLEPLHEKWKSFGFEVISIEDGHNCQCIDEAIIKAKKSKRPSMIILNTVKGHGVDFAENAKAANHSMTISEDLFKSALRELEGKSNGNA